MHRTSSDDFHLNFFTRHRSALPKEILTREKVSRMVTRLGLGSARPDLLWKPKLRPI